MMFRNKHIVLTLVLLVVVFASIYAFSISPTMKLIVETESLKAKTESMHYTPLQFKKLYEKNKLLDSAVNSISMDTLATNIPIISVLSELSETHGIAIQGIDKLHEIAKAEKTIRSQSFTVSGSFIPVLRFTKALENPRFPWTITTVTIEKVSIRKSPQTLYAYFVVQYQ